MATMLQILEAPGGKHSIIRRDESSRWTMDDDAQWCVWKIRGYTPQKDKTASEVFGLV
jgi:hypothetical protein